MLQHGGGVAARHAVGQWPRPSTTAASVGQPGRPGPGGIGGAEALHQQHHHPPHQQLHPHHRLFSFRFSFFSLI